MRLWRLDPGRWGIEIQHPSLSTTWWRWVGVVAWYVMRVDESNAVDLWVCFHPCRCWVVYVNATYLMAWVHRWSTALLWGFPRLEFDHTRTNSHFGSGWVDPVPTPTHALVLDPALAWAHAPTILAPLHPPRPPHWCSLICYRSTSSPCCDVGTGLEPWQRSHKLDSWDSGSWWATRKTLNSPYRYPYPIRYPMQPI